MLMYPLGCRTWAKYCPNAWLRVMYFGSRMARSLQASGAFDENYTSRCAPKVVYHRLANY